MNYQKELKCIRCESVGTIRKIRLHNIFERGDEQIYFVCTNCKSYGMMYESLTLNADEFPIMLDEEWEWADEHLLDEPMEEISFDDLSDEDKKALAKQLGIKEETDETK